MVVGFLVKQNRISFAKYVINGAILRIGAHLISGSIAC